jgi:putative photosynthetic complex assembly protein
MRRNATTLPHIPRRHEQEAIMSETIQRPSFPRGALIGAAALIGFAMSAALFGRITGAGMQMPTTNMVAERALWFEDRPDGGVTVLDARNNRLVAIIAPGTNGFLRATVRGLAQERRREDTSTRTPFQLTVWSDGRLTLLDPTTSRHIDLEAFGTTNAEAFAQLLTAQETPR